MWDMKLFEHPHPLIQWAPVVGAVLVAAFLDLRSRRIPNWLTGPLYLGGLVQATFFAGVAGLGESFLAGWILALPYVFLFLVGGGGAGDAKLMAALGTWLGVAQGLVVLASVCFTGVVLALIWAQARGGLTTAVARVGNFARHVVVPVSQGRLPREAGDWLPVPEDAQKMPYGVAIALGVLAAALYRMS